MATEPKARFRVMFDLSKRPEKEYIPQAAERVIWAAKNAQSKGDMHLPHFHEFERQGMNAEVVLTVHPRRLRDVIGHRSAMEKEGQAIIKNLLLGMLELRQFKMTLRDIQPANIAISADHRQLQFCSLDNIARHCKQQEQPYVGEMPYCCQNIWRLSSLLSPNDLLRDAWSIGIIILEVLVGTEVVIPLSSHEQIEKLMDCIEHYVDAPTIRIMKDLLI